MRVQRDDLAEAVKSLMGVNQGPVELRAEGDTLVLLNNSNYERAMVELNGERDHGDVNFKLGVQIKALHAFVTRAKGETVNLTRDGDYLKVRSGRARVRLSTMLTYSEPIELSSSSELMTVDGTELSKAINIAYKFTNSKAPFMEPTRGILLDSNKLLATNLVSLVEIELQSATVSSAKTLVLDSGSRTEISRFASGSRVTLYFDGVTLTLVGDRGNLTISTLSVDFPDVQRLLSIQPEPFAREVSAGDLRLAAETTAILGAPALLLRSTRSGILLKAEGPHADFKQEIECQATPGLSAFMLSDGLKKTVTPFAKQQVIDLSIGANKLLRCEANGIVVLHALAVMTNPSPFYTEGVDDD